MSSCTCGSGYNVDICAEQAEAEKHPYYAQPTDEDGEPFDLATIDTERNMRYVVHPFVSSEPYVNYCGLCALSTSDHIPGPNYVDPMDADGDPDPPAYLDPDALYDAAVDDAILAAIEDGRPAADWKEYMRGGRA